MKNMNFLTVKRKDSEDIWTSVEEYYSNSLQDSRDEARTILMLMQYVDTLKMMYQEMAQEYSLMLPELEMNPQWIDSFYSHLMMNYREYDRQNRTAASLVQCLYEVCRKFFSEYQILIDRFEATLMKG